MRTMIVSLLMPAIGIGMLTGCDSANADSNDGEPRKLDLALHANDLDERITRLEERVNSLASTRTLDDILRHSERFASLTPENEGYSLIETVHGLEASYGSVTVRLKNIEPYAAGSRVTIQLGNLTAATINQFEFIVEWGSDAEEGRPTQDLVQYAIHGEAGDEPKAGTVYRRAKKLSRTQDLRPGAWTDLQVTLEDVPPTDLDVVRIGWFSPRAIALY